jgi:hypothetical protein
VNFVEARQGGATEIRRHGSRVALLATLLTLVFVACSPAGVTPSSSPGPSADIKRSDLFFAYSQFATQDFAKVTSRQILTAALASVHEAVSGALDVTAPEFTDRAEIVDQDFQRFIDALSAAARAPGVSGDAIADAALAGMAKAYPDCHTGYWTSIDQSQWKDIVRGTQTLDDKMLDGGVGYVRWNAWLDGTPNLVRKKLDTLVAGGAKSWLFDLRGNAGGSPRAVVEMSSWFLNGEHLFDLAQRDGTVMTYSAQKDKRLPDAYQLPIAIVVDSGSLSASQFFMTALKAYGRAVTVGARMRGCYGAMIISTRRGLLTVTTAIGIGPNGERYNDTGIGPDVEVTGQDPVEVAAARLRAGSRPP